MPYIKSSNQTQVGRFGIISVRTKFKLSRNSTYMRAAQYSDTVSTQAWDLRDWRYALARRQLVLLEVYEDLMIDLKLRHHAEGHKGHTMCQLVLGMRMRVLAAQAAYLRG